MFDDVMQNIVAPTLSSSLGRLTDEGVAVVYGVTNPDTGLNIVNPDTNEPITSPDEA